MKRMANAPSVPIRLSVPHPFLFAYPFPIRSHLLIRSPSVPIRLSVPHPFLFAYPFPIRSPSVPIRLSVPHPFLFAYPFPIRSPLPDPLQVGVIERFAADFGHIDPLAMHFHAHYIAGEIANG